MNPIVRRLLVPTLAAVGCLVAVPTVASADPVAPRGPVVTAREHERQRLEHERLERERLERQRIERERIERIERERMERERLRIAREHQIACARASSSGAPAWRLREMRCYAW